MPATAAATASASASVAAMPEGLSASASAAACLLMACLYVLSLYLVPASVRRLPRDHPTHVRYRLSMSTLATMLCVTLAYSLRSKLPGGGDAFLPAMGWRLDNLIPSVVATVALMAVFYAGPIIVNLVHMMVETRQNVSSQGHLSPLPKRRLFGEIVYSHVQSALSSEHHIVLLRNLVVAPISEEVVFRGLMVPILFSSCCMGSGENFISSSTTICWWAPLFFGVAHAHHVYHRVWVNNESLSRAMVALAVQLSYTSIFGALSTYLLLRTGNLAAPVASHMICNFIGLPDLGFCQERGSHLAHLYSFRIPLLIIHALGLLGFWLLVDYMTSSPQLVGISPFWT